jgi:hypothetical protein
MLVLVASAWAEKVNGGVGSVVLVGKGKRTVANVFTKTRQWGKTKKVSLRNNKKHRAEPETCMSLLRLTGNYSPRTFRVGAAANATEYNPMRIWGSSLGRRRREFPFGFQETGLRVIVVQWDPTFVAIIRSRIPLW